MKKGKNIFEQLYFSKEEEKIEEIFQIPDKNFRVERILSSSQVSKEWYDQEENELVILLQGLAKIEYEENVIKEVNVGDYFLIKAHEKHRVIYTSRNPACVWLCIFYK